MQQVIRPDTFWTANGRAKKVVVLFSLLLVVTALAIAQTIAENDLLKRIDSGTGFTQVEADASDTRGALLGIVLIILALSGIVIYLMWLYRAHADLDAFTEDKLKFSHGWAVGWWFIPVANLVQPYRIVSEVWRRSDPRLGAQWAGAGAPGILLAWWLLYLVENSLNRVSFQMTLRAETAEKMLDANYWGLVADFLSVPTTLMAIGIVVHINRLQRARFEGRPGRPAQTADGVVTGD